LRGTERRGNLPDIQAVMSLLNCARVEKSVLFGLFARASNNWIPAEIYYALDSGMELRKMPFCDLCEAIRILERKRLGLIGKE